MPLISPCIVNWKHIDLATPHHTSYHLCALPVYSISPVSPLQPPQLFSPLCSLFLPRLYVDCTLAGTAGKKGRGAAADMAANYSIETDSERAHHQLVSLLQSCGKKGPRGSRGDHKTQPAAVCIALTLARDKQCVMGQGFVAVFCALFAVLTYICFYAGHSTAPAT